MLPNGYRINVEMDCTKWASWKQNVNKQLHYVKVCFH